VAGPGSAGIGDPTREAITLTVDGEVGAARRRPHNMVWVPGGEFLMGSEDFYPEERPIHAARVEGFWMDEHPVTVAESVASSRRPVTSPWRRSHLRRFINPRRR